jgi:tRNA 2-thiouridine synthesizing protein D
VNQWAELDIKNADGEPELVVCVAAALRRGMLDEGEALCRKVPYGLNT